MKKPNIILLMTDQQRIDTIGAHGYGYMDTPGMDTIVNNGTSFHCAYAPGSTCISSRAAIFTGMYPHNTGVYSFEDWSHQKSWVDALHDDGYHCVNIGKMHISPRDDMMSFDERVVVENPTTNFAKNGGRDDAWGIHLSMHGAKRPLDRHQSDADWKKKHQGVAWELDEHLQSDVFIGDSALAWLDRHEGEKPVFLQVGFTGPHEPYDPLPRHLAQYQDKDLPKPIVDPNGLTTKPLQHRAHQYFNQTFNHESTIDLESATMEEIMEMRKHYYAKITTVDEKINQILEKLEAKGYLENAVVLLISDHGDMLGDCALPYKWLMYDQITNVPFSVWDTRENKKQDVHELVSLMDVGPTILSYAGVAAQPFLEGTSLKPLIDQAEDAPVQEAVFCEDNYLTMVRTKEYKMVYYTYQEGEGELYDLASDPHELNNLFYDEAYKEAKARLKELLLNWLLRSNYNTSLYKTNNLKEQRKLNPQVHHYLHPSYTVGDFGYKEGFEKK